LSRLKKIQDTYKDVITPDDIQTIGEQQRRFVNTTERRLIAAALDDLKHMWPIPNESGLTS